MKLLVIRARRGEVGEKPRDWRMKGRRRERVDFWRARVRRVERWWESVVMVERRVEMEEVECCREERKWVKSRGVVGLEGEPFCSMQTSSEI